MREPQETDFGYRRVPLEDKQALVDDVFHSVARRYDLMNDLMSAGLHRAWKDALVTAVNPPKDARPFALLDLAGGTGDVALRVAAAAGSGTRVTVLDVNSDMLAVGRARVAERGRDDTIAFVEGNAEALPFPDCSHDAVTIAFGIRNVPRIERALAEAHRVLRIGGRFHCLEFSSVDVPGLDALYDLYSFNVIPVLGRMVAGDAEAYRYLVEFDPPLPEAASLCRHDPRRRLPPRVVPAAYRRRGGAAFRLAVVASSIEPRIDRRARPSRPPRSRRLRVRARGRVRSRRPDAAAASRARRDQARAADGAADRAAQPRTGSPRR